MKTPRTDEKMLHAHRRFFGIVMVMLLLGFVTLAVFWVKPSTPDTPMWLAQLGFAGIVVLAAALGACLVGFALAHVMLKAHRAEHTRVADGTVDGQ
jgi:uncharacterized integral membrane protein